MDDTDNYQPEEDTRSFRIWFKIDDPMTEPWIIGDLRTSDYIKLKHNDQYAYDFIMNILNKNREPDNKFSPDCIWKSIDDVEYTLLDCPKLNSNDKDDDDSNRQEPNPDNSNQPVNPNLTTLPSKPVQVSQKKVSGDSVNGSLNCNPDNTSNVKNKSKVWDYFVPLDSSSARCKFCQTIIKTSGNTSNLRAHLNYKHKMLIPLELQINTKKRSSAVIEEPSNNSGNECKKSKTQTKVQQNNSVLDLFKKANSYAEGGFEAEKLTNSLVYMIVVDHMPLRTVEKKGLQQFIKTARPQYSLPSRKTLIKLISDKYDVLKLKVIRDLDECPSYSITCDIWTDVSQKSYLGTTVHYLSSNNLEICSTNLCVKPLDAEHNSTYISTSLLAIFDHFSLKKEKITAIISDSAPNMIKAIEKVLDSDTNDANKGNLNNSKMKQNRRLPCFAHRLSHIVPKAIAKIQKIKDLIDKVKRIVMMTRKSVPAADELRRLQERDGKSEGTTLKFIQSVDTRWTSTYDMLERFLLLEDYVYPVTSKCANPPPMLSHEELLILKNIMHLMKPVMIIITELSGDSYLTCSIVIPAVAVMKNEIMLSKPSTADEIQFQNHLLASLDAQFHDIESFPVLSIATILDPRFKKLHFQTAMQAADAIEQIRQEMKSTVTQTSTSQPASTSPNLEVQLNKNNIWRHHDHIVAKTSATSYSLDGIAFELKQYITQPVIPRQEDPLKYWQLVKPSYPNLYKIAMKYFCVVGTSVPCERLFSEAGNIKTDDRNRLTGENLDKLLFLSSLSPKEWGF